MKTTIVTSVKQNIIITIMVVVGFILLIISGNMLANMGNIKNENPLLEIPKYMENMQWVMFLSAIILTILSVVVWKFSSKRKMICMSFLILYLLVGIFWGYSQIELSKYLTANNAVSELPKDVSASFMPISLNTFERSLDNDAKGISVYYVSRTDCAACESFEKSITPFLENNTYSMATYFTNSDRNGVRSEEMYKILSKYGIISVPAVIITKDGDVIELFLEPKASLDVIKGYLTEEINN